VHSTRSMSDTTHVRLVKATCQSMPPNFESVSLQQMLNVVESVSLLC